MKKHIHYFDYLRAIAAVCVIFMHVAATPLRGEINSNWHIINLITSFSFTAVPLFFMMSGYLILSDERTLDVKVLLKKRLPKLIFPLAAYTVIAVIWRLYISDTLTVDKFFDGLLSAFAEPAWVHLWYMYTLIALYALSPILCAALKNLDKNGHTFILSIIGLISLNSILRIFFPQLSIDILNKLTFYSGHLATFLLGYYLGNLKRKIPNSILFCVFTVTLLAITGGTYWLSVKNGVYTQSFQVQSAGFEIILAASIFLIFKQLCDKESKILKATNLVPLSLAIYLIHNILLSVLKFYDYLPSISSFFDTVIVALIILIASYLIAFIFAQIKPLCFLFTGLSFKSAPKIFKRR